MSDRPPFCVKVGCPKAARWLVRTATGSALLCSGHRGKAKRIGEVVWVFPEKRYQVREFVEGER